MAEQTALNLVSACFGFVAAIYFCIGSALTSHEKLVALSKTYWGCNLEFAKATVAQSTQYATGGLLLLVSFILQIVATQASPTNQLTNHPIYGHYLFVVAGTLLIVGGLSKFLYSKTNKVRMHKVEMELKQEKSA
ncbi:MAG: hypothetical protein PHH91_04655 [Desulfuromonadaceae bacterium]|nr:hypothetical protein [Desulfuromonadaceae bacterium]